MKAHYTSMVTSQFALMMALVQPPSPWTVVQYPSDVAFHTRLVPTSAPAGCDKCDVPMPGGEVTVTKDDEYTTLTFDIYDLPTNPGRYYLYLVDDRGHARRILALQTRFKGTHALPNEDLGAFMLIVSADDNLATLPSRDQIVLYSDVPKGLRAVPR